jgi:hypothetical protein
MNQTEVQVRSAKEEVRELLEKLADEASFEDIQYHIYVREKLEHGFGPRIYSWRA